MKYDKISTMRNYKKKTLALILASTITVAGSFAANNYQNSIMQIDFKGNAQNSISALIQMKSKYEIPIIPLKTAPNTYVITLPEINSEMTTTPTFGDLISSVDVRTMPYTTDSKGYTKITIKTQDDIVLDAKPTLYIPEVKLPQIESKENQINNDKTITENNSSPVSNLEKSGKIQIDMNTVPKQFSSNNESNKSYTNYTAAKQTVASSKKTVTTKYKTTGKNVQQTEETDLEHLLPFILGALIVFAIVLILFIMGKKKMAEVIGQSVDFDFDDEPSKTSSSKKKSSVKNTINKIDKKYTKTPPINLITGNETNSMAAILSEEVAQDCKADDEEDEDIGIVVDLDQLYNEKINQNNTEFEQIIDDKNEKKQDDLADFLNEFTFEEEIAEPDPEPEILYNETLYDEIINNNSLSFSNDDLQKIDKLLNSEISDEIISEVEKYISNPQSQNKKLSKEKILENFITTYTIERDIIFTSKDIEALNKLISVEIDESFIKDLRTNITHKTTTKPTAEKNMKKEEKPAVLQVKDLLPDLSKELEKQGGKKIQYEGKVDTVYFSEGYEVNTFSVPKEFIDMDFQQQENTYRPSDDISLSDEVFEVEMLDTNEYIPTIEDAKKHPEMYESSKEEPVIASEEELLKRISNVTFKPFYEDNENIENMENDEDIEDFSEDIVETLTQEEIKEELKQFEGFEIVENDSNNDIIGDSELNVNNDDSEINPIHVLENGIITEVVNTPKLRGVEYIKQVNEDTKKLLDIIEQKKHNRNNNVINTEKLLKNESPKVEKVERQEVIVGKCIIENKDYTIRSTYNINDCSGFYIGESSEGFLLIGFINNNYFALKHIVNLPNKNMQVRVLKKLSDKKMQYIVKMIKNKFIINVSDESMEFVMEL